MIDIGITDAHVFNIIEINDGTLFSSMHHLSADSAGDSLMNHTIEMFDSIFVVLT